LKLIAVSATSCTVPGIGSRGTNENLWGSKMKQLYKFLRLPSTDQCLLIKSLFLLGMIRLGLWLFPYQTLRHLLVSMTKITTELQEADQVAMNRVAWAVVVVSPCVPSTTCLTQALATQVLLARLGHHTHLRIGVAKGEDRQLKAHAWVESQGRVIIGGSECLSYYTPLPALELKIERL
jgi:uncharacterized lipoprotein YddW (UPF0748 family)